jgi:hypothetical protein
MNHNPNKNVEARLLIWLQQGKSITAVEAIREFGTNRISEYVRRLRNKNHKIETEIVTENGSQFGRYYMDRPKKVSKIKSQEYRDISYICQSCGSHVNNCIC